MQFFDHLRSSGYDLDPMFLCGVGSRYKESELKILLVGKATAGWTEEKNPFSPLPTRIYLKHTCADDFLSEGGKQHTAFWRFAKKLNHLAANSLNGPRDHNSEGLCYLAWTNLFKIAAHGRNPSKNLIKKQLAFAETLLRVEICTLKPTIVVFATEGWNDDFVYRVLNIPRGIGDDFVEISDGVGKFYFRYPDDRVSHAVLWVPHPERKLAAHVQNWIDHLRIFVEQFPYTADVDLLPLTP